MKKLVLFCAWGCFVLGADSAIVINHNLGATNVGATRAYLTATITDTGAAPVYVAFYWGGTDGGTNAGAWAAAQMPSTNTYGTGTVSTVLYALAPASQYWFRAYAWSTGEYAWAAASTNFTTLENAPTSTHPIATRHLSHSNWVIQDWATLRVSNDVGSAAALGAISNDYLSKQGLAADYNAGRYWITNVFGIAGVTNEKGSSRLQFGAVRYDFNDGLLTNVGRVVFSDARPASGSLTKQPGTNLWWGYHLVYHKGNFDTAGVVYAAGAIMSGPLSNATTIHAQEFTALQSEGAANDVLMRSGKPHGSYSGPAGNIILESGKPTSGQANGELVLSNLQFNAGGGAVSNVSRVEFAQDEVLVGSCATATAYGVAVGLCATGIAAGVAVGTRADGSTSGAAVGYQAIGTDAGAALGYNANAHAAGVALGAAAAATNYGVAAGSNSKANNNGVAIGRYANGDNQCVAVGYGADCGTQLNAIVIGPLLSADTDNATYIRTGGNSYIRIKEAVTTYWEWVQGDVTGKVTIAY